MGKSKIAYYILILISAVELGKGIQLVFTSSFWSLFSSYARLNVLLQVIISFLIFFAARILKPKEDEE
ncbi:MAG: hypothetical protein P4L27_08145 [Ignavibacteriaceae bacterium]|jgi:hypothetical protein|nr:hypothetical protein [Ignavibacteriaceae bacterium]